MGRVIAIHPESAAPAESVARTFVTEAYAKLGALDGFIERNGQRELSFQLAQSLIDNIPFAAEAPTGTGKTIAYLVGGLAAAQELRKQRDMPIVVATATVGLQTQIMTGDLPLLVRAGVVSGGNYALAKGRSRYFCAEAAQRVSDQGAGSTQTDFFDASATDDASAVASAHELLEAWHDRSWAGDFDSYGKALPSGFRLTAASADTCLGPKCSHYSACPFFNARRSLSSAKIIVANHDLVLADLSMALADIDPLFPGVRYLAVFDEAHHLPTKAQDAGSASIDLSQALLDVRELPGYNRVWPRVAEIARAYSKAGLDETSFSSAGLDTSLQSLEAACLAVEKDPEEDAHRFVGGTLPASVHRAAAQGLERANALAEALAGAQSALKNLTVPEGNEKLRKSVADVLYSGAFLSGRISQICKALSLLTSPDRSVRWLTSAEDRMTLHSVPMEGARVLQKLLWGNPRATTAMVSATIRDFAGYDRFQQKLGVPELRTFTLQSQFDYAASSLCLVNMNASPSRESRTAYEAEMLSLLLRRIDPKEGTLVLFPSRALMAKALPAMRRRLGASRVKAQYEKGLKDLVAAHKADLDRGEGSVLCGLATMAEGLDLPGKLCTHVVICTLPFTVPTSPLEQELREELGREYFGTRALPDTLVKLTQMVGRLIRRESDRGRITIFDNRLLTTRWGHKLVHALPAFTRRVVEPDDLREFPRGLRLAEQEDPR